MWPLTIWTGDSAFGDEGVRALHAGLISSKALQALDLENKVGTLIAYDHPP